MKKVNIADRNILYCIFHVLTFKEIRISAVSCVRTVIKHFFAAQFRAKRKSNRIPVYQVDHELDKSIPFRPEKIGIYLNFTAFWIRALSFLMEHFAQINAKKAAASGAAFVDSIRDLYSFAAEVYREKLSTTQRPRYLKHPRFMLIHFLDPHLMCIPSLHVMIVIRCYTMFRQTAADFGRQDLLKNQINELRQGALGVTESILFVKQHSINCISAALYALYTADCSLFTVQEAKEFIQDLFKNDDFHNIDAESCRLSIQNQFDAFINEKEGSEDWRKPLLSFLEQKKQVQRIDVS